VNANTSPQDEAADGATKGDRAVEPLSRERVLTVALDLVDGNGLEGLTMRRLGHRLERNPMSLYRYFTNRAALLDSLVEHVLDQLPAPGVGIEQDWQGQLRSGAHQFRTLVMAHPNLVPLLVTQPLTTPLGRRPAGALRLLEQLLTLLTSAGLDLDDALRVARTYTGCLLGQILTEVQQLHLDPAEPDPLYRLGLNRIPRQQYPQLRSAAAQLAHYDGVVELDFTLDVLFAGLTARLADQPHRRS